VKRAITRAITLSLLFAISSRRIARGIALGLPLLLAILPSQPVQAGTDVWTKGTPLLTPVLALAIDPANSSRVYAGTAEGLFRSNSGGAFWDLHPSTGRGAIRAVVVNPARPATVYVGAEATPDRRNGTVFKSTDSGATWLPVGGGLPAQQPTMALAIDPVRPATLYAATLGGVFKTTNAGASWTAAGTGLPPAPVMTLAIDPDARGTLYAGTRVGVFKTTNGGTSWTVASTGLTDTEVIALAIDALEPETLYAATAFSVFKTIDGAATWSEANIGIPSTRMQALAVDPASSSTVFVGTLAGVYKSEDGGISWNAATAGLTSLSVAALAVAAGGARVFAGASGVFKSDDGGASWIPSREDDDGLKRTQVHEIAIDPAVPSRLYAATTGGVFKSTDKARTWRAMTSGMMGFNVRALLIDPAAPTILYAATAGGVFQSTNAGATWRARSNGLASCPLDGACVRALVMDPALPSTLFAGAKNGVFRTVNAGATWTKVDTGLPGATVYALAIDPATPTTLYVGYAQGIYKSDDGGDTWRVASTGLPAMPRIQRLVIDPTTPTIIYAAAYAGLFKSMDGAQSWSRIGDYVGGLAVDPIVGSTLYGRGRVVKSVDGGVTWDPVAPASSIFIASSGVAAVDPVTPSTIYTGTLGEVNHLQQVNPPDLTVTASPFVPASAIAGGPLRVGATVRNIGGKPAPPVTTRYYLSFNAARNGGDMQFPESSLIPRLAAGAEFTATETVRLPLETPQGSYFVIACTDEGHAISEALETNNCRASSTTVAIEHRPDLVVRAVSNPPASVARGATFTVTATTDNAGAADAAPSRTRFYLSLNTTKGDTDHKLGGSIAVPVLLPGNSYTDTVTVTVPPTVAPGSYYLIACADDTAVLTETKDTNNCRTSSATGIIVSQTPAPRFLAAAIAAP
jgi:photosystem II stability/assembly factor-like uncharacterized protein